MKTLRSIGLLLLLAFALSACTLPAGPGATGTPAQSPSAAPTVTPTPAVSATAEVSPTASASATPAPGGTLMYSSYAHMVSYDPARGFADFDYFEMLNGEDAVNYLVEEEGYTLADAQAEVADYADSEFIEKNTNTQLRTIDLRSIPIKLMVHPDGTVEPGATPYTTDLADLFALYHNDASLVLDAYFYYVTVVGGEVISVEQVYWP